VIALAIGLTFAVTANAALINGDVIVIDFGRADTYETAGNWNNWTGSDLSDLIRHSDGANTGVSLATTDSILVGGADVAPTNASFRQTGTIPDNAQRDLIWIDDTSGTVTFSGLNDSLTYNVDLMERTTDTRDPHDVVIDGISKSVEADVEPWVTSWSGVSTDGNGNLEILFERDSGHHNFNALEIQAIPEPASLGLFGIVCAALWFVRRKFRSMAS